MFACNTTMKKRQCADLTWVFYQENNRDTNYPSGGPFYLPKYFFFKPNIQETQRLPQKSTFNSSGKLEEAPFFMETWNIFACLTQQCMLRCAACTVRQVQNLNVT